MPMPFTSNRNLPALCGGSRLKEALHILLTKHNPSVNYNTFSHLLQTCISNKALSEGKQIHPHINHREFKFTPHKLSQNTLIRMYDKCGCLVDARQVFDQMTERDLFSWNIIIAAYRRHGHPQEALTLFHQMQPTGVQPDHVTFASILPACAKIGALKQGTDIHQSIMEKGLFSNVVVANALVDMYAKWGSIHKARELFDKMPERNVVSWNTMISGYVQNGFVENAVEAFKQLPLSGVKPDSTTFASVLPAYAKMGDLEQGMDIHQSIMESGFLSTVVVANALVDMYAKCGSMHKAHELFIKMPERDVVSWNAMIGGYAQNGFVEKALETFKQMQLAGVMPDPTTFSSILPACAKIGALEQGRDIHQSIMESGFFSNVVVANALVDMYAKCGSIHKARELFDKMPERNVVSWNAMIAGYAQIGFVEKALGTFKKMQLAGLMPDPTTFASILPACATMGALEQGMDIHQSIMESGFFSNVIVANALVDMYAKCGSIQKARELFDKMPERDVVSWNAMLAGYAQNGFVETSLETFKKMQLAGVMPDSTTFSSILPACAKMRALEQGKDIHQSIIESGFLSNFPVANALVDMYAKCGSIHKAHELFDKMPERNVVSWNAMIAGYAQNGFVEKAVETYKQMQLAGVIPDPTTFVSILPACAKMGALEQGMDIHQHIMESDFLSNVAVANALVDMYAKCGSIHKAQELFDKMPQKTVVSWNALIAGYAQNGLCKDALKLFELMKHFGTYPNKISFTCVLLSCSHAGLVDEGCKHFNGMSGSYCIMPTIDHYACMVDLLGRAGYLEETLNFIIKIPTKPVVIVWMCLLGACRSHKNIRLGLFTATLLFELDPQNAATYVLLSNIYAEAGRWGQVQMMNAAGYFPDSKHVLIDVDKEEKELFLCHHSEKHLDCETHPLGQLVKSSTFEYMLTATLQPNLSPRLLQDILL